MHNLEEKVQPLIVPAILEHEEVPGMSGKPGGLRSRVGSVSSPDGAPNQKPTAALIQELSNHHKVTKPPNLTDDKQNSKLSSADTGFLRCGLKTDFLSV